MLGPWQRVFLRILGLMQGGHQRQGVGHSRGRVAPRGPLIGKAFARQRMLATKISFINEIATICEKVGADVRDVRTGIGSDSRIGYQFIYPGVGYGGSCFPKDVKALIHTAEKAGVEPQLLNAVEEVNARQKKHMISESERPSGSVTSATRRP